MPSSVGWLVPLIGLLPAGKLTAYKSKCYQTCLKQFVFACLGTVRQIEQIFVLLQVLVNVA